VTISTVAGEFFFEFLMEKQEFQWRKLKTTVISGLFDGELKT